MATAKNPIGVYYEHPRWFQPVFAEMDRRGVPYVRLDAARHHFDLARNGKPPYSLVFNRMSPSAWTARQRARDLLHAQLARASRTHGRARGQRQRRLSRSRLRRRCSFRCSNRSDCRIRARAVINHCVASARRGARPALPHRRETEYRRKRRGNRAFRLAGATRRRRRQRQPRVRPRLDRESCRNLFPRAAATSRASRRSAYEYLYGIKVFTSGDTFDLCPMDICKTTDGAKIETALRGRRSEDRFARRRLPAARQRHRCG